MGLLERRRVPGEHRLAQGALPLAQFRLLAAAGAEAVGSQHPGGDRDHDRNRDIDARVERPDGLLQTLESD